MVSPAEGFYATPGLGRNEIRIAYVLKLDDLRASVAILREALPAYRRARNLDAVVGQNDSPVRYRVPHPLSYLSNRPGHPGLILCAGSGSIVLPGSTGFAASA